MGTIGPATTEGRTPLAAYIAALGPPRPLDGLCGVSRGRPRRPAYLSPRLSVAAVGSPVGSCTSLLGAIFTVSGVRTRGCTSRIRIHSTVPALTRAHDGAKTFTRRLTARTSVRECRYRALCRPGDYEQYSGRPAGSGEVRQCCSAAVRVLACSCCWGGCLEVVRTGCGPILLRSNPR